MTWAMRTRWRARACRHRRRPSPAGGADKTASRVRGTSLCQHLQGACTAAESCPQPRAACPHRPGRIRTAFASRTNRRGRLHSRERNFRYPRHTRNTCRGDRPRSHRRRSSRAEGLRIRRRSLNRWLDRRLNRSPNRPPNRALHRALHRAPPRSQIRLQNRSRQPSALPPHCRSTRRPAPEAAPSIST